MKKKKKKDKYIVCIMQFSVSIESAVFKLIRNIIETDWANPPSIKSAEWITASAFAIEVEQRKLILTNAHCVAHHGKVQLIKRGSSNLHKCRIRAVIEECDLAILEPINESFWNDVQPLQLYRTIPAKGSRVYSMGYPLGGYNISITEGIVSRIVTYEYSVISHGIAIQVDSPINSGNSGGPVLSTAGQVVGVVVAKGREQQGISGVGYIIPIFFIDYILEAIPKEFLYYSEHSGHSGFTGIVSLPIEIQPLHNERMRESARMPEGETGVLIVASNVKGLNNFDILTHVNGIKLHNDGMINLSELCTDIGISVDESEFAREIVHFQFLISLKHPGSTIRLTTIPKKLKANKTSKTRDIIVSLQPIHRVIPMLASHLPQPTRPNWVFIMGMVFTDLSYMLLRQTRQTDLASKQGVALSYVHETDFTEDFPGPVALLHSVNGKPIENISQLLYILYSNRDKSNAFVFEFKNTSWIAVISKDDIAKNNKNMAEELGLNKLYHIYSK